MPTPIPGRTIATARPLAAGLGVFLAAFAWLLLLAAPARAQECTDCHDTKLTSPMHADLGCAACHSDVDLATHPDTKPDLSTKFICSQCHDTPDELASSAHATTTCKDCHGVAHDVQPVASGKSPMAPVNQVQACGRCHKEPKVLDAYLGSVHARALLKSGLSAAAPSCSDCHGSHSILAVKNPASKVAPQHVPETCGKCHEGILTAWKTGSAHGMAWQKGDKKAPVCTTCHSTHQIIEPTLATQRLKFPNKCGGCHKEELQSYRDSFHGQSTSLGFLTAATCADCHTPHGNLPAKDSRSTVNPAHLRQTCGRCHGGVSTRFASFDPHADPADAQHSDPKVHGTYLLMTILLFGTFTFFTIHALLWLQRGLVGSRRGELAFHVEEHDGKWVRRFRRPQIWTHVVVVTTFLLLAATGLPLRFHGAPWAGYLARLLGGIDATRVIHRIAALGTFGYFLWHAATLIHARLVKKEQGLFWGWRSMVPRSKDLRDLLQNLRWFLYLGPRPQLDRFTYWEKFDYFAVFWGVAVIGFSGLVLWFPRFFATWLPGWFLNVAHVVHSDEALLATGFIFIFHFFHTHLRPESFPLDTVIFTGRMPLHRFQEERPAEYARLVEHGQLESLLDEAPSERELRLARGFGFTAVAIGLLLALGILIGLFAG